MIKEKFNKVDIKDLDIKFLFQALILPAIPLLVYLITNAALITGGYPMDGGHYGE